YCRPGTSCGESRRAIHRHRLRPTRQPLVDGHACSGRRCRPERAHDGQRHAASGPSRYGFAVHGRRRRTRRQPGEPARPAPHGQALAAGHAVRRTERRSAGQPGWRAMAGATRIVLQNCPSLVRRIRAYHLTPRSLQSRASMINSSYTRLDAAVVEAFRDIPTTIIADVAGRRGALDARVRSITPGLAAVGTAFTVEVRPGDNLMIHAALMLAQPGDILVVDGKADTTSALMGELMC